MVDQGGDHLYLIYIRTILVIILYAFPNMLFWEH